MELRREQETQVGKMTATVISLPSGDVATMVVDVRVAPVAPRRSVSVLGQSYRVSVVVPMVSNPPLRLPFGADRFAAFEVALAGWTSGWSLRPGLTVGFWLSPNLGWVRDESRVYDVVVPSFVAAEALTAKLYARVKDEFDQEEVLISVTPEYMTLLTTKRDEAHAA